jgi:hypothetical protein
LRWLNFAFPAFCYDLALLLDNFSELSHRKDFENERLLVLIAELLNEFDEGLVLFVQARRWAEKEDALKQRLPPARNVELAEDIEQNLCLSACRGAYEAKGRRQGREGLTVLTFHPFACPAVHRDVSIRAFHL